MNYTYILKSKRDSKLYVGSTTNLRKRFWQHANGKSSYTKSRGPFALIYYEACVDEGDARSREKYLKQTFYQGSFEALPISYGINDQIN